ncbi:uncharacterized protein B0I36DRAFT_345914 [Microdochium trichocladiopsis]|uniref:Uncharacterized protein n=1 Tax=Microdochium trichocladiopsis TaxID=1682393 RepID=A0A9P8YH51_9PEZI|nr:uncharacterized protein B0I36DRAFT_345914 [Microdochium trichocladiopsis]KAH7037853.1 hypothetical protein B0I36DRAFT_345914 [Microdochium trichocladiopsis]
MDSTSGLLAAPKTGRSRFSKALPAPPPGLNNAGTSDDTVPFPQLPVLPYPQRKQGLGMATMSAAPGLASSLGARSFVSPVPQLPPSAPFATDASQLPSPAPSAIKRKPVRKPVPEASAPRGNASVDEKALPPVIQGRGAEPAGSTANTLPFRTFGGSLASQTSQSDFSAKQNSNKQQPPPPPPPKQNNAPTLEAEPRISDAASIPGSVLGDILSTYSFPTPPLGESFNTTPKTAVSEAPVKKPETVKLGRKPVGSPPAVQLKDEPTAAKHPLALTPGPAKPSASVPTPTPSAGRQLEVKQLPRVPGVGLRPGDKRRSPLPFEKSPRVAPSPAPVKSSEPVISPVAEEMGKIKDKFKAFVHKRTSSTDASSLAAKSTASTAYLADDGKNVSTPTLKDLPVIPTMSITKPVPGLPQQPSQGKQQSDKSEAPSISLPTIEKSSTGDLMPHISQDSQMGGLNVILPQQQQQEPAKMTTSSSTASLTTLQTSISQSQPPSVSTSESRSLSQDRRPMDSRGDFPGARPRAGTNTSMASSIGPPRGRGLRPVASAQNLNGPPPAGFRSGSRPRGATNDTLPPFAPSPMINPFRQRPRTATGPPLKGPRPLDGRELYNLADSLSKNALVRKFHEERADSFPVREAEASLTEEDQAKIQSIRKLFPLQLEKPVAPTTDVRVAPPITDRHYNCWFRHENWVTSQNEHNSVECQTCHKKEKDPRMVCCGCDVRICYECYERLIAEKRDLRAMLGKQASA